MVETYSRSRLIAPVILAIYVYGSIAALLGTILPQLGEKFGLDDAQLGYLALAQGLGLAIASVAIGPILDKRGKKTGILAGTSGITLSLIGLAYASGHGTLLSSMLLLGLAGGMLVTSLNALVSDIAEEKRSSTLNLLNLFFGLGGLGTPFIAANIPALDTSFTLCLFLALISATTFVIHLVTAIPGPTGERRFLFSEAVVLLNQPSLYLFSLLMFLYVACEYSVWNWFVKYLVFRGVEEDFAQNVLSLGFALGLLVGRVIASRVLLGVPEIRVTVTASIAMTFTTFGMLLSTNPILTGVAVFLAGLAMAPMFPTVLGMVGNLFSRMSATAMGIVITSGWIGLVVSSPIVGWIANHSSLGTALIVLPVMSIMMIVVNLVLRPYVSNLFVASDSG